MQKAELIKLLQDYRLDEIVAASTKDRSIIRMLTSLVYDKEDVRSWRAIEAIGVVSGEIARTRPDVIRNLSQRFLWMLREESGNGPGSAPELLGEIVRQTPDAFSDIGQVVTSFHDEKMLRRGVMRAIWRIIDVRPDLLSITDELMQHMLYLRDEDATVRAYALMIAGKLGMDMFLPVVKDLTGDGSQVRIYDKGEFLETTIAEIARNVCAGMAGGER